MSTSADSQPDDTATRVLGSAAKTASSAAQGASDVASSAADTIASGAAKALGDASATAHHDEDMPAEVDHSDVPKAHPADVPERVKENPHLDEAPKVAHGDVDRPAEPGIEDLGWSEDPHIPNPVIHGMTNEDFWVLVRRFNKQTYHVKALDKNPPGDIDMNIADKDEFFPDKLRSTLERLYTSVGISMVALFTHIVRIRSWKETRRTSLFAVVYLVAWFFDYLMPAVLGLVMLLFVSPRSRQILFPPAPLAAISSKGSARVPKSGHLGSADSATGAAESYKGEAVEQEASNLVSSISHVAVSTAIGKGTPSSSDPHPDDDVDESDEAAAQGAVEDSIPDPTAVTKVGAEAQDKAAGDKKLEVGDHTAAAVDTGVWATLQPILHGLEDLCDTWERFGNALSPTPPFHQNRPRLTLAAAFVLPIFLVALITKSEWVYKGTGFGVGFGFFGQPLFDKVKLSDTVEWLNKKFPHWKEALQLRNSLLKGVPTNAQLTVTLMRIAEAAKCPLPPPPPIVAAPKPEAAQGKQMVDDLPPEYQEEMKTAVDDHEKSQEDTASTTASTDGSDGSNGSKKKAKKGSVLMGFLKGSVGAGALTILGANRAKATAGSNVSKNRLGVVKKHLQTEARGDGPSSFKGRYKGRKGYVDVITTASTNCVAFEPEWGAHAKAAQAALDALDSSNSKSDGGDDGDDKAKRAPTSVTDDVGNTSTKSQPATRSALQSALEKARPQALFSIQIDDIAEVRKIGGLGFKGKLVVGWALSSEIADGLEITTREGERIKVTALPRRDEVFNRLVSLGSQRWEMW